MQYPGIKIVYPDIDLLLFPIYLGGNSSIRNFIIVGKQKSFGEDDGKTGVAFKWQKYAFSHAFLTSIRHNT